ncbi:F0F1 ATP synthase subunit gamma [Candidatus Hepatobacter penaei]|uniref:F0F1 ATP synthase subunit gamma n=1 Tax=Candidatus Hepatobacter penaei TaxID=1274402 RepID=UPI0004F25E2E|nr:FoF1 ATP synthase subunit gamma [Candidatus Hepatobacter penaei]TGW14684.1 hypothetical protein EIL50_04220 [bacterium NHP-B]
MPTLQSLSQRRDAVTSTKKIMSAMKMVAAAKLKRFDALFKETRKQKHALMMAAGPAALTLEDFPHYTHHVNNRPSLWIILGANRGLCGHFHTQLIRSIETHIAQEKEPPLMYVFGDRLASQLKGRGHTLFKTEAQFKQVQTDAMATLLEEAVHLYDDKKIGRICVVSTHFKNALSQDVKLLSLNDLLAPLTASSHKPGLLPDVTLEPTRALFVRHWIQTYLVFALYHLFVESILSEEGCRMTAMDGAVRNSEEILEDIGLSYNRQRQAMITKELTEVISGAQALC